MFLDKRHLITSVQISGLTLWLIAAPMILLYLAGMLVVERRAARAVLKINT